MNQKRNYRSFIWHAVFLSITVTFTEVNTVIPALILQIGGREIHVGIVSAIMIGIPLVSKLNFAGFLHSKSRKKPSLLLGINLRVLALLLIAFTLSAYERFTFTQLLLLIYAELLMFTLGGAFAGIAYVDLIGKSFDREMRKRFFTRKQIISSLGILLSAGIARSVMQFYPYPVSYMILFAAAGGVLLTATLGFWRIREQRSSPVEAMGYLSSLRMIPRILRSDRNLRWYLIYINAIGAHTALTPFYVAFARNQFYLDAGLAGNILFIQIIGMIAASLLWPKLVRQGGFKRILKVFAAISVLLPPTAILLGHVAPLWAYLLIFPLVGVTISARMITENSVIVELSSEDTRVLYSGIVGTLNVTIVLLPVILGALIGWVGYIPVFIGVSLSAAVARRILPRIVCPADLPDTESGTPTRTV